MARLSADGAVLIEVCDADITDGTFVIPASVTSIGTNAFMFCHKLNSITIPSGVTTIGSGAFLFCINLNSVNILDGVTTIERGAFRGCKNLLSITMPDTVIAIQDRAFSDCPNIDEIIVSRHALTSIQNLLPINLRHKVTESSRREYILYAYMHAHLNSTRLDQDRGDGILAEFKHHVDDGLEVMCSDVMDFVVHKPR